jgi:hypothetical protein
MYGRITLMLIFKEIVGEGTDWIHLAQDRCQLRAVVKRIMNVRFEALIAVIIKSYFV